MAEDSLEPLVTQCPTCRTRFRATEVQLGEIDMRLDNSKIAGGIVIAMPNESRAQPAFGIGLALDQINVDAYMPVASAETAEQPADGEGGGNRRLGGR